MADHKDYLRNVNPRALTVKLNEQFRFVLDNPYPDIEWRLSRKDDTHLEVAVSSREGKIFVCGEYDRVGSFDLRFDAPGGTSVCVKMTVVAR